MGHGSRAVGAPEIAAPERAAPRAAQEESERLPAGERATLASLYRQHHEAVRAFAGRLVGDAQIAEDLVHDVFVKAPRALRRFRGESTMRTFLIALAVHESKHHVRAASRRRRTLERFAAEAPAGSVALPDELRYRLELAAQLQRALDRLPLDERVVVVLCEIEERTSTEVAAIVGAPEATVRTRLHRAKRRLREALQEEP